MGLLRSAAELAAQICVSSELLLEYVVLCAAKAAVQLAAAEQVAAHMCFQRGAQRDRFG